MTCDTVESLTLRISKWRLLETLNSPNVKWVRWEESNLGGFSEIMLLVTESVGIIRTHSRQRWCALKCNAEHIPEICNYIPIYSEFTFAKGFFFTDDYEYYLYLYSFRRKKLFGTLQIHQLK